MIDRDQNVRPVASDIGGSHQNGNAYCNGDGRFMILAPGDAELNRISRLDEYSAAKAFVNGKLTVRGDLCAAIRFFSRQKPHFLRQVWFSLAAKLVQLSDSSTNGRHTAVRNIRFHYDRSNAFYRQFLGPQMLYSAADFSDRAVSLEEAQERKLEGICRRLDLHPNQRFLDVGCGWGALVAHAAERFGVTAVGCTLSRDQYEFARSVVRECGLDKQVAVQERDYRDLQGNFDKIASVGMFEHVGRKRLRGYFQKIYSLLDDRGLFLNRGIVRPETVSVGPATLFLQRNVFPGGELVHLADVVREAELAGFGVLGMKNLRQDYALTCHAWVDRLVQNAETCIALTGEVTYRTWLLYLAASAVNFEDGVTDAVEVTFEKGRSAHASKDSMSVEWR